MTTYPNERLQFTLREFFPNFVEIWINRYSTFDEAWNLCRSGATMVGILLEYAPTARDLHWVGLRATQRALGLLSPPHLNLEFQRMSAIKEIWLKGSSS
jgi:hypothetical protein